MRIIQQTLAEQDMITVLRTGFCAMGGKMTDKTTTSDKEEVHIIVRQMRKGIKGITVNGHEDRSREVGIFIEFDPVGVMIIRHGTLNYLHTFHPTLYMTSSVTDVSLSRSKDNGTNRRRIMNVGLTKIIGDGMERPGIGSSEVLTICSLRDSLRTTSMLIGAKDSPKWTLMDLAKGDPCEPNKTKEEQHPHAKGDIAIYVCPLHYSYSHFGHTFILML
jgi:hypothetical protein